jgi:hypothetical protein
VHVVAGWWHVVAAVQTGIGKVQVDGEVHPLRKRRLKMEVLPCLDRQLLERSVVLLSLDKLCLGSTLPAIIRGC